MNRLGYFILNVAVSLYLFVNGILGITSTKDSDFYNKVSTIFNGGDFTKVLTIILSVCAIVAGVFLLLSIFKNDIAITELILLVFIILWVIFIIIVDIIHPLKNSIKFTEYLTVLSSHLLVLGALISSTRRFGNL